MASSASREILFEYRTYGAQMRVTAIDPDSGKEVVIIAPATAQRSEVQKIAMAKLNKALEIEVVEPKSTGNLNKLV